VCADRAIEAKRSVMGPRRRKQIDPLEQAIETALAPGNFISYNAAWSFVEDVQGVANSVSMLIESEPERAIRLYETFIAACHEKAEEIDDSSGNFGMLVEDLFCGWMKACQASGLDRHETAKSLLAWMEDDPYGFCYHLDREAVKVLDKQGLDAFARCVRAKFEMAAKPGNDEKERFPGYASRRWGGVLKTIVAAQRNIDAYIALCEETELGTEDCKTIADMYRSRRRFDDALAWVERGLEIVRSAAGSPFADQDLAEMKRALLAKLGRPGSALGSAWAEFWEHPSTSCYKELMRYVPAKERKAWHEKAMEASEKGDLSSQIELWLQKKEIDRLVARLRRATDGELEDLSHSITEPAARKLGRSHPEVTARIYQALGMRIVNAGKAKYYDAALDNLRHAKKCYVKSGLEDDWEALVADVRDRHYRKKGFMAGFEQIVSGAPKHAEPTFLERAKRRWPRGGKR
jgi:tetratricopeptide (TPR) repeat protein